MNNPPPSTPFPVPGFHGGNNNASPAEFLEFLRSLTTQYLGDKCDRIRATDKTVWVTIVDGLTDHFLGAFPQPDIVSWNTMQDKVEMTEATLEVIRRVFLRVDGIYTGSVDLFRKVFVRLLDLCGVLDIWKEAATETGESGLPSTRMREKTILTLTTLLRGLDGNNPSEAQESSWKALRRILQECVDVCAGVYRLYLG